MFNVVNPDMIVERYGADTLRLYEMFLGPVEQSKPWDTNGIDGCHRFLKKFWSLFPEEGAKANEQGSEPASKASLKSVHKLIKKVSQDIENFSYNCHNAELLRTMVVLIAPFAPHIAEELWERMGGEGSVCDAQWPEWNEEYLVEDEVQLSVTFNGKKRFDMTFAADASQDDIQKAVLADERTARYTDGKQVIKVIVVPKRLINIVVK